MSSTRGAKRLWRGKCGRTSVDDSTPNSVGTALIASLVWMIIGAGCTSPQAPQPAFVLPLGSASLTVHADGPSAYHVSYMASQWNSLTATLQRAGITLATLTSAPSVDPGTQARVATVSFDGLQPGAGYSLTLKFALVRPNEPPLAEGTLTRTGISLSAGGNSVAIDGAPEETPTYAPGAPLGAYVESLPAAGVSTLLKVALDVVPGIHGDYFYIDDGAIHHAYRNAAGNLTTALVAGQAGWMMTGNTDGSANVARFSNPTHLLVAQDGSVFVADTANNEIRKITFDAQDLATVTTVAGNGTAGFQDGPATTAMLNGPRQIAFDPNGNIVIADQNNDAIRLLTLTGPGGPTLTTLAGGTRGYLDGPASTAEFNAPDGVAVDPSGRIFVSDVQNHRIRMLAPSGSGEVVTTVAGDGQSGSVDGPGTSASFAFPVALATNSNSALFVLDFNRVRQVTFNADGSTTVRTIAGAGGTTAADSTAAASKFSGVSSLAVDSDGSLLVGDVSVIRRIVAPGATTSTVVRMIGSYGSYYAPAFNTDGPAIPTDFVPNALAEDASGTIYTVQGETENLAAYPGGAPTRSALLMSTLNPDPPLELSDGPLADETSALVTQDGLTFYYAHPERGEIERLVRPSLDATATTLAVVAGAQGSLGHIDGPGSLARFDGCSSLIFGPRGALYAADSGYIRKLVFDASGTATVSTIAGDGASYSDADGPADRALFSGISGMAFDHAGELLITDNFNVRKLTFNADGTPGQVSTIANGQTDFGGVTLAPRAIAVDRDDNVYVAGNTQIYKLNRDSFGQVFTSLFSGSTSGDVDGPIAGARFAGISGLLYDPRGYLYVLDDGNTVIRRIDLP